MKPKKQIKLTSVDITLFAIVIIYITLLVLYFTLANNYNVLSDLYSTNCVIRPAAVTAAAGYNINITGFI